MFKKNFYLLLLFIFFIILLFIAYLFARYTPEAAEVAEVLIKHAAPLAPEVPVSAEVVVSTTSLIDSSWSAYVIVFGGVAIVRAGLYFGLPLVLSLFAAGAPAIAEEVAQEVSSVASDPTVALEVASSVSSTFSESAFQVASQVVEVAPTLPAIAVPAALMA